MTDNKSLLTKEDLEGDIRKLSQLSSEGDEYEQEEVDYKDRVYEVDQRAVLKVMKKINEDGTIRQHLKATKSDFVSKLIYLDGKPFDF